MFCMTTDLIVKGKVPGDAGGQAKRDLAMCHYGKKRPATSREALPAGQQRSSPLLSTGEIHLESCAGCQV